MSSVETDGELVMLVSFIIAMCLTQVDVTDYSGYIVFQLVSF